MRGKVRYDYKADRDPDYWIFDLQPGWDSYRPVTLIVRGEEEGKVGHHLTIIYLSNTNIDHA